MVLDLAPPLLTISLLDCEALDVMYGFDFTYEGNHDEVVTEALGVGTAPGGLTRIAADPSDQLRAVDDPGSGRIVPAPVPAGDRDADQHLPGPDRASSPTTRSASTSRSASTGAAARTSRSSTRFAASARSARKSSAGRSFPGSFGRWRR